MKTSSNYLAVAAVALLTNAAVASAAPQRFTQAAGATLKFHFVQAGADTEGSFGKFSTELAYDENNLATSSLKVTVQVASLDTQEQERDGILVSPDMLDAKQFPTAQYTATSLAKRGEALEAVGKLTLHGVTRDLRLPMTIRKTAGGVELSGETTIHRLDFGVGQGDLKSTEWVGNDVKLQYKVPLARAQ